MLDLLDIARTEAAGGDLRGLLERLFEPSEVRPTGYPNAVIFEGGNHDGNVNPVAHSLTDAYALVGTIAAIDVLGLPYYAVPMWAQYRHDLKHCPPGYCFDSACSDTALSRMLPQIANRRKSRPCAESGSLALQGDLLQVRESAALRRY